MLVSAAAAASGSRCCRWAPQHRAVVLAASSALRRPPRRFATHTVVMATAAAEAAAAATTRPARVAVIGAGAAGLAAARELVREGLSPVVFEASPNVGGTWVYSPDADGASQAALLGATDPQSRAHSSMYAQLRTNLPREVMSFTEFPFTPAAMRAAGAASADARRFPGHAEVLRYLEAYADAYGLRRFVRHRARVVRAAPVFDSAVDGGKGDGGGAQAAASAARALGPKWELTVEFDEEGGEDGDSNGSNKQQQQQQQQQQQHGRRVEREVFDALIVANGHYSATNLPDVAGMHDGTFPGLQMHSHNYRTPDRFAGQTVLVVGASNSGEDLCREIGEVAAKVYVSARSWKRGAWGGSGGNGGSGDGGSGDDGSNLVPIGTRGNIERRGMVVRLTPEGGAEFEAGAPVPHLDAVIYATGYRYEFAFLSASGVATTAPLGTDAASCLTNANAVNAAADSEAPPPPPALSTADQRVAPLWRHMYAPRFGATLAFIGLPWKVVPFPQFELQARLAARALSGRAALPGRDAMAHEAAEFYAGLEAAGVPRRWTHMQGDEQWAYNAWLCGAAAGEPPLPQWREAMYAFCGRNRREHPESYRDVWAEREATAAAAGDLAALEAKLAAAAAAGAAAAGSEGVHTAAAAPPPPLAGGSAAAVAAH